MFHWESGLVLEEDAQRSCEYPIAGAAERQVGWDPGKPDLVGDSKKGI